MYESFYGLAGKPFQPNPDPNFFFASRGHARAYAYLQYGLHQGQGFIVVAGDPGAGKTTLLRSLVQRLDATKIVAAQLVGTQPDAEDLLKSVATAFGIPAQSGDKARRLAELDAFFTGLASQQKRALLIVDEAQKLGPRAIEELRALSNLQVGDRAAMQSFIIGQPELRQMLQNGALHELRQSVLGCYHLGPLESTETQCYIEHRLKRVRWNGDPTFDSGALGAIHAATAGVPRRINTLCNRALLAAYLGEKHVITAADIQAASNEMRLELGRDPNQLPFPLVPVGAKSAVSVPVPTASESELAKIQDRLARLERMMQSTVSLLHSVIDREQQGRTRRSA
jgi:general secretion pathway protein A